MLTPRQAEVLAFVATRVRAGFFPSLQEVAAHVNIGATSIAKHVRRLVKLGHLVRGDGMRTLTLARGWIRGAAVWT
jgi:DNA-binding MarR family transcriptional regulator